jgi:VanZ family protein
MKLRLILGLYILFIILVSVLPGSGRQLWQIDKVGHFFAYGGLIILAFLTFQSKQRRWAMVGFAIALGIVLEWVQSFVPGRQMSFVDGVADILGVFLGIIFFHFYGQVFADWLKRHGAAYLFD